MGTLNIERATLRSVTFTWIVTPMCDACDPLRIATTLHILLSNWDMLLATEDQSFRSAELDPVKQTNPSSGEQNRLWGIWNDRISLLSHSATSREAVSLLTCEIQSNTALLNNATFRASTVINSNDNDSNKNGDETSNTTLSHLTHEQKALVVRLEAEKAHYLNLSARLIDDKITGKGAGAEPLKEEVGELGPGSQECDEVKAEKKLGPEDSDQQRNRHDSDCEQSRIMMSRLSDKMDMIKSVLGEMHRIAFSRASQERPSFGRNSPASSDKRKHGADLVTDSNEDQSFAAPSFLHVPSRSQHHVPISEQDTLAVRVELERCMHQVSEINLNADRVDITTDLLEVALDELRAERAQSVQECQEAARAVQAEVHAEVTEQLGLIAQQTIDLDMQAGEVTGTLTGLVLHVDDLEETVEQEGRCKNEMQTAIERMKANMRSYAALQAENTAAISALDAILDNYPQRYMPSASVMTLTQTTRPSLVELPGLSLHPVCPLSGNLGATLFATIPDIVVDTARPLLDSTRSKITQIVEQTRTTKLQALDVQVAKTLNAVKELTTKTLSHTSTSPSAILAHAQALIEPLIPVENNNLDSDDAPTVISGITPMSPSPPASSPPIFLESTHPYPSSALTLPTSDPQPLPAPMFRAQSVESLRYTPPPEEITPIVSLNNIDTPDGSERNTSLSHSPVTRESPFGASRANIDCSHNTDIPTPEAQSSSVLSGSPPTGTSEERVENPGNMTTSQQLDCSFLADPSMQGIPVRLQPVDAKSHRYRPFAFSRIIPAAVAAPCGENGDAAALTRTVEVRDCRRGYNSGKFLQLPLDAVCYLPPTAVLQTVVCVTPDVSVGSAQKYFVLRFDDPEAGQCIVRKDPKPKGRNRKEDLISLPTHLLAQVARPVFPSGLPAPLPAAVVSSHSGDVPVVSATATDESNKKLTIKIKPRVQAPAATKPKVHFDHPPPMWLTDPVFAGYRVQLKEQDGDGSILELISVDKSASTVEVQPLLSASPHSRSVPLKDVRHVVACAPYQMVVVIAGKLKGTTMKVGKYDKDKCTLYTTLGRRQTHAIDRERTYKTVHLAVILPPRK